MLYWPHGCIKKSSKAAKYSHLSQPSHKKTLLSLKKPERAEELSAGSWCVTEDPTLGRGEPAPLIAQHMQ